MNDTNCKKCKRDYALRDGCDPTPYCDECAHILVEKLESRVEVLEKQNFNYRSANKNRKRDFIPKITSMLLACLCLATVQRKGAQDLVDLARREVGVKGANKDIPVASVPVSTISNLYSADFARSFILRTNYPAPSPVPSRLEAPVVKAVPISQAAQPPPTNGPIVLPQFLYTNIPPNYWWHRLEADTLNGPWRTNDKNMTMPPSGTVRLVRTNKAGYFQMFGTREKLP